MNRPIASLLSAACLVLAGAGAAVADEHHSGHGGEHGGGDYPTAVIERPLELPRGMLEIQANLAANLSPAITGPLGDSFGGPFKPTYLGFGAAYGVDGHLQVAVSSQGFCLTGTSNGCDHVFDDFAVEAAYGVIHQKGFEMSIQGGLEFAHLAGSDGLGNDTPMEIAGGIGVDLRVVSGQFAIRAGPKLQFGLKERGEVNREQLAVPLDFIFQATPQLALDIGARLNLLLDPQDPLGFGDYLTLPVSVSGLFAIDKHLDVGAVFTFTNLLGKHIPRYGNLDPIGLDGRSAAVFVNYRL